MKERYPMKLMTDYPGHFYEQKINFNCKPIVGGTLFFFSEKSQTVNSLCFVGHEVSATTIQLCNCNTKANIENIETNGMSVFNNTLFTKTDLGPNQQQEGAGISIKHLLLQTSLSKLIHMCYENAQTQRDLMYFKGTFAITAQK